MSKILQNTTDPAKPDFAFSFKTWALVGLCMPAALCFDTRKKQLGRACSAMLKGKVRRTKRAIKVNSKNLGPLSMAIENLGFELDSQKQKIRSRKRFPQNKI